MFRKTEDKQRVLKKFSVSKNLERQPRLFLPLSY